MREETFNSDSNEMVSNILERLKSKGEEQNHIYDQINELHTLLEKENKNIGKEINAIAHLRKNNLKEHDIVIRHLKGAPDKVMY